MIGESITSREAEGGVGGAGASSVVVCGWLVLFVLLLVRRMRANEGKEVRLVRLWAGERTKRAMQAVTPHSCREVVP